MPTLPAVTPAPTRIPIAAIATSPFNPRKTFDHVPELAESIRSQGLLQNLLVRRKGAGRYELIAGECRLRAVKLLKWTEVEARVIDADDGQARAAQIVENLQRADVTPLEEADGLAQLQDEDRKKWTPAAIAAAIGKSPRFVQQRLALARNLAPAHKAALRAGKISVEVARTLAGAPQILQAKVEPWAIARGDVETIVRQLREHAVPAGHAAFDAALYKGEIFEHGTARYFADVAQFEKLQTAAAQALVDKLRAGLWKKAKLVKAADVDDWCWADSLERIGHLNEPKDKTQATGKIRVGVEHLTAIVWIDDDSHKLRQASRVVPFEVANKARPADRRSHGSMPARESAAQRRSRLDFNQRLHVAMTDKVDVGLRALLCRYIGQYSLGTMGAAYYSDEALDALHDALLPPTLAKLAKADRYGDAADAKIWAAVNALPIAKVHKALAGYGARDHYAWDSHDGAKPKGFEKLIAAKVKIVPRDVLTPAQLKAQQAKAAATKSTAQRKAKGKKHP